MRLFFIVILLLFISCEIKEEGLIYKPISISIDVESSSNLKMSEFFSDIEYIELVTPPNKFVGNVFKIINKNEKLFLYDRSNNNVWVFSEEGYYLNDIQIPVGRGPADLEHLTDIYITDSEEIHALGQFKIVVYDVKGNFLRNISLEFNPFNIFYLEEMQLYGGYAATMLNSRIDDQYKDSHILYFDNNGEIFEKDITIRKGSEGIRYNIPNYFSEFNGDTFFSPHLDDTIYKFEDGQFVPYYSIDFKEFKVTEEVLAKRDSYSEIIWDWRDFWESEILNNGLISNITFYEFTDEFLFLKVGNRFSQHLAVYNRATNEVQVGNDRFINDIDKGPSPFIYLSSDTDLFTIIDENTLIQHAQELDLSMEDFNEQTKKFVEFANAKNQDGNPVIVKYVIQE